jgi:hypothetical protein
LYYAQAGISKNWTGLGNTVFYGEWARVDNGVLNFNTASLGAPGGSLITGSRATVWGLGVVQHVDAAAMEIYLAYRRYSARNTGCTDNEVIGGVQQCTPEGSPTSTRFNDFDVVMGGARIRF